MIDMDGNTVNIDFSSFYIYFCYSSCTYYLCGTDLIQYEVHSFLFVQNIRPVDMCSKICMGQRLINTSGHDITRVAN